VNFSWWVNRKGRSGNNFFEGGFLGLDNIGVFDRSAPLPTGGHLEQADGTAWMVHYSQQMLRIAVELANSDPHYEDFATKFFQHTMRIADAMDRVGERHDDMWDEEDGFFYDVLRLPDGNVTRLKVRSMVSLLPLTAKRRAASLWDIGRDRSVRRRGLIVSSGNTGPVRMSKVVGLFALDPHI
jgi:hypothetical protein